MPVQRNKAIVGQNAFAHEAGIHQDGMLKDRSTYEIMKPEDVGLPKTELVLGKHSGRHALKQRIEDLGYHLDDEQFQTVFDEFKALADRKKVIYDADIEALAETQLQRGGMQAMWTLEAFTCNAGTGTIPMAAVCLWRTDGEMFRDAAMGDGPIDAVFKAIERITGIDVKLQRLSGPQRHRRRGRPGRGGDRGRVQRHDPPRPRRQHRHRRGQRAGVPASRQPHLPKARPRQTSEAKRHGEWRVTILIPSLAGRGWGGFDGLRRPTSSDPKVDSLHRRHHAALPRRMAAPKVVGDAHSLPWAWHRANVQ